jgi:hypothetical protein
MPNKPISHGYKLYALADHGYVWYWIWASRAKGEGLIMTGTMVYHLLQKLPQEPGQFTVYLDNYFISINLFKQPRNEGIVACGTDCPSALP